MMQPIKWQTGINYIRMWQNGVNILNCKCNHLKVLLEVWVLFFFSPWDSQNCIYTEQT